MLKPLRHCTHCGAEMQSVRSTKAYCSDACRKKASRGGIEQRVESKRIVECLADGLGREDLARLRLGRVTGGLCLDGHTPSRVGRAKQHSVFPCRHTIELAFATPTLPKYIGHLRKFERRGCGGEEVEQYLEALLREFPHRGVERIPPYQEESAHRVFQIGLQDELCGLTCDMAEKFPAGGPLSDAAAMHLAAAHDDVETLLFELVEHFRQERLIVLQVSIDHGEVRRSGRQHAFHTGT